MKEEEKAISRSLIIGYRSYITIIKEISGNERNEYTTFSL